MRPGARFESRGRFAATLKSKGSYHWRQSFDRCLLSSEDAVHRPLAIALASGMEHLEPSVARLGAGMLTRLKPYLSSDEWELNPPERIFTSENELEKLGVGKRIEDWLFRTTTVNHSNFDTPEYSWGYLTSRALGVAAKDITLVAQDGNRVKDTKTQVARLIARFPDQLPGRIFIFWTGNDICAADLTREPSDEDYENYFNHLWTGLELLAGHMTSGDRIKLYVLGYLEVSQLVEDQDILSKKIKPYGSWLSGVGVRGDSMTVDDFRSQPYIQGQTIHALPHPANMCKGIC